MIRSRRFCLVGSVLVALLAGVLVAVLVLQPWAGHDHPRFPHATVAANGYECASIGREILEKNGSAVDAAIATLFCEGVACAQCMGLGGGFLATVYDATTGQVQVLNARERAPMNAHRDMFENASSTVGGLAIAVPGELRGYGELHRRYGRLPWADLVRPTADLCRRGHHINEYMARVLRTYSDRIKAEPSMREVYVNPETGEVWKEGDIVPLLTLAKTLDIISEEGPEAIHNGTLTALFVQDIQAHGGIVTEEDLRNYRVEWQKPIEVPLTDHHTLYTAPLPGTGSVLAFMLNMLRGWVEDGTEAPPGSNLYWHRVVETFKYAYAKRTGLGDPSRYNITYNIAELERNLSNPSWAAAYRDLVDDDKTFNDWKHYGATFAGADDHGTAQIVVIAPDGSAVSATSTINYIWGCQRRSSKLGIMLNNEMDDFAIPNRESSYGLPPSPANMVEPGLQPLSSMVPSIVLRNKTVQLVIGAAGGTKITTQVALAVRNTILEGRDLPETMQRPRLHHQLMPMEIEHEYDFSQSIIRSLQEKGHATTELGRTAGFAAMVAAGRDADGYLVPQTDRRRVGSIDGF
ncbi:glutathione hydrolase 1 proenzyme-like isoform X2 [Galleria mellonella]|uniref:Glutathione hydrolase 1 proenzyme-like isoform X2 n=1 Tax=Galleria mellonella TaxID=7137 RepID=A0ABM3M897_GALME|nr:glutathione hydrolase 1 proenzyme-like isoform X2 [Galleria mellonella]